MSTKTDILQIKFTTDGEGRVRASLGGVAQDLGNVNKQADLTAATMGKVGGVLAGFIGIETLRRMVQAADTMANLSAKIRLVTESKQEAIAVENALFAVSQRTSSSLEGTVTLYARIAGALRDVGASTAETVGLVETINQSFAVSGAGAGETSSAVLQLSQALGAGALRGEEFNSVNEAAPRLMQALADSLGVSRGALRGMAEQGKLTADVIRTAFSGEQAARIAKEYSELPDTVERAFQRLKNSAVSTIGQLNESTSATGGIADALSYLSEVVDGLPQRLSAAGDSATQVFGSMDDNVETLLQTIATDFGGVLEAAANELMILPQSLSTAVTVMIGEVDKLRIGAGEHLRLLAVAAEGAWLDQQENVSLVAREIQAIFGAAIDAVIRKYAAFIDSFETAARATGLDGLADSMSSFADSLRAAASLEAGARASIEATTTAYADRQAALTEQAQAIRTAAAAERAIADSSISASLEQREAALAAMAATDALTDSGLSNTEGTRKGTAATVAASKATKERAAAQREAADVIARMAEDFDAADEAAAAFEATIEALLNPLGQLTAEYDAQHAALEEQMRLSVGNAAAQAKVAEAMRVLEARYKGAKQAIDAQNKPVEALIDNLEFELRLMKMGNAEREAAIALRGMESEATDEQRAALVGLMQDREVQAAMEDQAHMWGDLIADQVGGIVDALKKGGDGLVDGIADGLRSSLDSAFDDALANFGNELGNLMAGTGSMGSTLAAAGGAVLAAAGSIGASYIGGTSSMGQSVAGGAVAGAAMGAQIGTMIMPGIGTAIGAVIGAIVGAIIGFVAHQDPILEVASNASGINHGKVEGRATSAFGEIYVGKDDLTLQGNMQSQELADKIKDFDNAIASMLTAAEIELGRAALANFDFNQRGHGLSPAEVLAARFEAVVQAVEPAWMNFLDGLGSLEDQVNAFQGLRTMRDQLVVLDELMLSIDGDPFEQMRFAVNNLQKAVDDGQIALDAAILKQNPLEIAEASSQLTQAIMRRYQAEMEMVLKLASALAQVEQQARAFTLDIAQRIAGVGGPQSAVTGVALANLNATRNNVINADDTERALEHLQEFISSVDAWLQSARAEVDVWHAEQTAALNARLTALDDEVAGINAAAQARAQAESQYNAQLQAMQQALLDAERARLQELLSIAQAWVGVLDNAQSLIDELTRGTANPLSGEARMNLVNTELTRLQQQLLTAPESERAGIAEQITQLLNERLALAQTLYDRPSGEYLGIYNNTLAELGRIRDMAVDPAARAAELQAELNGLQAGTTTAVTSFASQSASYSDIEAARLEEIELERRAIEAAQKLLDEEQARRLAAIDDEARAYYEWAQGEGVRLLQQQHDEITAALDLITGGLPVDEYIIDLQERTTAALENIRDNLADFLAMAAATVAGSGGTLPGGGGVRPPGDSGAPIGPGNRPRGTGETGDVVLQFTGDFVGATPADAQVMADAFATQLRAHLPQIARDLKTELRVA